ncbi:MAG: restriction endonuclease subunit S [Synergistaceae bacterium]|jgi:type I restriction enzyme S subunit|nr:restriction endonuclease subunit S [Synergistaceae bacterium]
MRIKLGDVAQECRETIKGNKHGLSVVGLEHLAPSEVTLSGWSVDGDNTFTKAFHKGQMLFGRRRAYLKKAALAPFDGICSGDITVIESKHDKLLPELLPFIIQNDTFFDFAVGKSAGSLSPRAKWEHLREFEFELPSIAEQRKLADLLWAANATREAYKKLLAVTDELVKSQFVEEVERCFADGNYAPLNDLIQQDRPITYGILKPGTGFVGGIPVVKVKDFPNGYIDQSDLLLTSPEIDANYKRSKLLPGDLLISIRGTVGRLAEVPETLEGANITQDTARLSIKPAFNRLFVRGVLETPVMQNKMQELIRGVAVKGINIGDVRKLPIPQPSEAKQNHLADVYRAADKSKFALQRTIDDLEATYKAFLREKLG